jgi:hypothetical protein
MGNAGPATLAIAPLVAIRRQLATTPGRLRLAAALLTLGAIVFGLVTATAARTRTAAVDDVTRTGSLLVRAVEVSASLSDAHATAALSFLVSGTEPAASRKSYDRELGKAAVGLAELADEVGGSTRSGPAVHRIIERLPVYAGLIDSARANQRQGYPVAGAYVRLASREMRRQMLPRARALYEIEARDLVAGYRAGVSGSTWLAVILAGCAMLALLATTQIYLHRATRRILNPPLVLATAVLLALVTWIVLAFAVEQHDLSSAQSDGSDPVELLTATSILASRAQAEESVVLSARGGAEVEFRLDDVDRVFGALVAPIGGTQAPSARGSGGLLDVAVSETGHSPAAINAIYDAYRRYRNAHDRVVELERVGDFSRAVKLALASTRPAADELNAILAREVDAAQDRFKDEVDHAKSRLEGLAAGVPLLTALFGVLALLGVRIRLEEYR